MLCSPGSGSAGTQVSTSFVNAVISTSAQISQESELRSAADSSLASQLTTLSTSTSTGIGSVAGSIQTEATARSNGDYSLVNQITALSSSLSTANASLNTAITNEASTRASADTSNASQIGTVQAQANQNAAAVQTVSQSLSSLSGSLSASYTIKTQVTSDGRTYIAGIGVGVNSSGGVIQSSVLVSASQFAIIDPNGTTTVAPFAVSNGQVYMNSALIGAGTITSAMIGSYIASDNYVAGSAGWRLDKGGTFEINAQAGGGRTIINGNGQQVYDSSGTLRVKLGYLG
ncbi:DUF1983 domain-containing protein [Burkholderia sp. 22PA0106]|uniref:phage tail tip fiber protein n=1 Tax=Burkholderia sp. 22PA0106 TaxID=3237371 RepID=UPI0039C4E576